MFQRSRHRACFLLLPSRPVSPPSLNIPPDGHFSAVADCLESLESVEAVVDYPPLASPRPVGRRGGMHASVCRSLIHVYVTTTVLSFSYTSLTFCHPTHRPFPRFCERLLVYQSTIARLEVTRVNNVKYVLVFDELLFPELSPLVCHCQEFPSVVDC